MLRKAINRIDNARGVQNNVRLENCVMRSSFFESIGAGRKSPAERLTEI
jgi:hypothetical protein